MLQRTKIQLRKITGIILIVVGIAGIILPILPGWWVILLGLEILGWKLVIYKNSPWWKKIGFKNKHEHPLDRLVGND